MCESACGVRFARARWTGFGSLIARGRVLCLAAIALALTGLNAWMVSFGSRDSGRVIDAGLVRAAAVEHAVSPADDADRGGKIAEAEAWFHDVRAEQVSRDAGSRVPASQLRLKVTGRCVDRAPADLQATASLYHAGRAISTGATWAASVLSPVAVRCADDAFSFTVSFSGEQIRRSRVHGECSIRIDVNSGLKQQRLVIPAGAVRGDEFGETGGRLLEARAEIRPEAGGAVRLDAEVVLEADDRARFEVRLLADVPDLAGCVGEASDSKEHERGKHRLRLTLVVPRADATAFLSRGAVRIELGDNTGQAIAWWRAEVREGKVRNDRGELQ